MHLLSTDWCQQTGQLRRICKQGVLHGFSKRQNFAKTALLHTRPFRHHLLDVMHWCIKKFVGHAMGGKARTLMCCSRCPFVQHVLVNP